MNSGPATEAAPVQVPRQFMASSAYLLSKLGLASAAGFAAALQPLGLHPREFAALSSIQANGGSSQTELGLGLGIDPSTIVAVVDQLERDGLAERRRDPTDRRRHALHLTEAGVRLLVRADQAAAVHTEAILAPLSAAERQALHALLFRLATAGHLPAGLPGRGLPAPPAAPPATGPAPPT